MLLQLAKPFFITAFVKECDTHVVGVNTEVPRPITFLPSAGSETV